MVRHLSIFLILVFIIEISSAQIHTKEDCGFDIEVEVNNTSQGKANGRAKIKVRNGGKYFYVFFRKNGLKEKVLTKDMRVDYLQGLKPGKYYCYVMKEPTCRQEVGFIIR